MRTMIIGALMLASASVQAQDGTAQQYDRFRLYTSCAPLELVVESLHPSAADIRLTEGDIITTVRSRLRGARIYTAKNTRLGDLYLYVNIAVVGLAFSISVQLKQTVLNPVLDTYGTATTWSTGSIGTHGTDAGYILQSLGQHADRFVDEYLAVNESACE